MASLAEIKSKLVPGEVYRRCDVEKWSNAVDRHLKELQQDGSLEKVAPGLYYSPVKSVFGKTPPKEELLVRSFLKDDRFLLTSPNDYNKLGVGTTQLYNKTVVYNAKRHGNFRLGNRLFSFQRKPHFPSKMTPEFLLVDLLNNLDHLAEDPSAVLKKAEEKAALMDHEKLANAVREYGNARTKKQFTSFKTVSL